MIKDFLAEIIKVVKSDHPLIQLLNDIRYLISSIWNYSIFETADKHPIAVSNIIIGVTIFILGLKLAKYMSIWVRKKLHTNIKVDLSVAKSLERISYYIFIVLIAIFVLDVTNVPLTAFTVVGTTLALGVGLGSQNIANNFISGLIIMVERPIKLGDIIEIKNLNVVGKVINIGARCVSIRAENNISILIPNSNILQDTVINWTLEDADLKTTLEFHVEQSASQEEVDDILYKALSLNKYILKTPLPKVLLKEITYLGLSFEIEFWIDLNADMDRKYIINDLNRIVDQELRAANIKIVERK